MRVLKGFVVPAGYRLVITKDDGESIIKEAGEQSGSQHSIESVMGGEVEGWVLEGDSPQDQTSPDPEALAQISNRLNDLLLPKRKPPPPPPTQEDTRSGTQRKTSEAMAKILSKVAAATRADLSPAAKRSVSKPNPYDLVALYDAAESLAMRTAPESEERTVAGSDLKALGIHTKEDLIHRLFIAPWEGITELGGTLPEPELTVEQKEELIPEIEEAIENGSYEKLLKRYDNPDTLTYIASEVASRVIPDKRLTRTYSRFEIARNLSDGLQGIPPGRTRQAAAEVLGEYLTKNAPLAAWGDTTNAAKDWFSLKTRQAIGEALALTMVRNPETVDGLVEKMGTRYGRIFHEALTHSRDAVKTIKANVQMQIFTEAFREKHRLMEPSALRKHLEGKTVGPTFSDNQLDGMSFALGVVSNSIAAGVVKGLTRMESHTEDKFRAYAKLDTKEIHLHQHTDASIVAHEVGHLIEATAAITTMKRVLPFLYEKTFAKPLKEFPKEKEDSPPEYYKEDSGLKTNYTARIYRGSPVTEVVSTGLEFMYRNPLDFAHTHPEHFKLILGLRNPDTLTQRKQ